MNICALEIETTLCEVLALLTEQANGGEELKD